MVESKYPKYSNFYELICDLHNEKFQKEYLAYIRWGDKPKCVHCGQDEKIYKLSSPGMYECPRCKKQFSVLFGTIFERSSIPMGIWFWAMFEFCIGLSTSPEMGQRHQVEQKTAYYMGMRLRQAQWEELNRKLEGDVYADEMEIGADPVKDIRVYLQREALIRAGLPPINTRPIFGMIQVNKKKKNKPKPGTLPKPSSLLLLFDIPDKSEEVLKDLVFKNSIAHKTNLYTDGWSSYTGLNLLFRKHYIINRNQEGLYKFSRYLQRVDEISRKPASLEDILSGHYVTVTTNAIENIWSHIQIDYWRCHGYSQQYAQMYLNEFMFRFNHRHLTIADKFLILVERCCRTSIYGLKIVQESGEEIEKRVKIELNPKFKRVDKKGGGYKLEPL